MQAVVLVIFLVNIVMIRLKQVVLIVVLMQKEHPVVLLLLLSHVYASMGIMILIQHKLA
jgi:hypothetical protein